MGVNWCGVSGKVNVGNITVVDRNSKNRRVKKTKGHVQMTIILVLLLETANYG